MVVQGFKWLAVTIALLSGGTSGSSGMDNAPRLPHPFYIGVTEMNYNEASKSLEISCKAFTDDLETALGKANKEKPDLFQAKNKETANKEIEAYLKTHLLIKINGKAVTPGFLGFERENEAVWSYLEAVNVPQPRTVEITNSILYDAFDQQINLVHVTVNGARKSSKLQYPDTKVSFEF